MEIGMLVFEGVHTAEEALKEVYDAEATRRPWLDDVGVITRPMIGRIAIHASYPETKKVVYRAGDVSSELGDAVASTAFLLGALAGPFNGPFLALDAGGLVESTTGQAERELLHIGELKQVLPRSSSALVLIGEPRIIDEMIERFASYGPKKTVRRDLAEDLWRRLRALRDQALETLGNVVREEPAPAMH